MSFLKSSIKAHGWGLLSENSFTFHNLHTLIERPIKIGHIQFPYSFHLTSASETFFYQRNPCVCKNRSIQNFFSMLIFWFRNNVARCNAHKKSYWIYLDWNTDCLNSKFVFQCPSGSREITLICFFSVLFRECSFSWLKWKKHKQGRISARILFCSIRHQHHWKLKGQSNENL